VLITSRFSDWSELADEVPLDVLPLKEAVALLENRTGRNDAAGAKMLAEGLDRLPLALDHAAALCKRTQMRFAYYAEKASSLIDAAPRGAGYPRSVAATFNLAIAEAVAQCQAAEALMAYLAQCAPERIPMTLVEGAVEDEPERLQALAALDEVSLIKHDAFHDATPAISVHRLVQAVARTRSQAKSLSQETLERFISRLLAIYPKGACGDPNSWPLCAQLTPHLLARQALEPNRALKLADWADLLDRSADYFFGRQSFAQGTPLARDALTIREKALGREHPDTATSLFNLANLLLYGQGDPAARALHERALAICEKVLGPEHPVTMMSLNHLAVVLNHLGDHAAARLLSERGLAIQEKAFGPQHSNTAASLNNLARPASRPGRPCSGTAALRARIGHNRKGVRPPAFQYGGQPQQPRPPASRPGRPCSGTAALRARIGHRRKGVPRGS
jgi:Tetratricopeptide repeat